mmetsp:Transcript_27702/g.78388  ORF Transcript_27702/g.78388 Transcript_27702/m.78388 type:complete len:263 (+) Transcript_27702:1455-2243(+)
MCVLKASNAAHSRCPPLPRFGTKPMGPATTPTPSDTTRGKCRPRTWCTIWVTTAGLFLDSKLPLPAAGFAHATHSRMLPSLKRRNSDFFGPQSLRKRTAASTSCADGPLSIARSRFIVSRMTPTRSATPWELLFVRQVSRGSPRRRTATRVQRSPSPADSAAARRAAVASASGRSPGTAPPNAGSASSAAPSRRSGHSVPMPSGSVRTIRSQRSSGGVSWPNTASYGSDVVSRMRKARWASHRTSPMKGPSRQKKLKVPSLS